MVNIKYGNYGKYFIILLFNGELHYAFTVIMVNIWLTTI